VHDLGITVVVAEHRLERVIHHADRVVLIGDGGVSGLLDPADAMVSSPIYPPVIGLGRALRWSPLPLSVRDARRRAADVRDALSGAPPATAQTVPGNALTPAALVDGLTVRRGAVMALRAVSLAVRPGEVVAVMGRNGAGKSTLLASLVGHVSPASGSVRLGDLDPGSATPADVVRRAGMVPQDPALILYAESVAEECEAADRDFRLPPGTTAQALEQIVPGLDREQHPRDLSEGQRVSLALAVILASGPSVVLLDEPTRGLDYAAKRRLVGMLRDLSAEGKAVVLATHDVELAAEVASRVVVLAEGEVVADGPAPAVLAGSPAFAPQVSKVLHPLHFLTVEQVVAAVGAAS
jgi:energy-coupling factor transport system ATP-binding protein